jgi:hypothetical protein
MKHPTISPLQKRIAVAALAELRMLYCQRLDRMQSVIALLGVFDGFALPVPAALSEPGAFDDIAALGAGLDEFAEFIERAQVIDAPAESPAPLELAA